jgi:flagellar biosynthesis GTPase FlhF
MKLQTIFIQSKIKEIMDTPYYYWNDTLIIKLCHYSVQEEFKKYKSLLKLLFQDFLINYEQKKNKNILITFTKEELHTIQKKLSENNEESISTDPVPSLLSYLDTIKNEKEKAKEDKAKEDKEGKVKEDKAKEDKEKEDKAKEEKAKEEKAMEQETYLPKKYINNLHDAEIFTNDEYILDFRNQGFKYFGIFLGVLIIFMTFISKSLAKLRSFSSYGNHFLSNQYNHMQSLLENKLMESLLEKNNFMDLFSAFSENKE